MKARAYRITTEGRLSERFAPAFEGKRLQAKDGKTVLQGEGMDQGHGRPARSASCSKSARRTSVCCSTGPAPGYAAPSKLTSSTEQVSAFWSCNRQAHRATEDSWPLNMT